MVKMIKKRNLKKSGELFSLDSLIDIISNTLGIVILLTLVSMVLPKKLEVDQQERKLAEAKQLAVSHVVNTKFNIFFFAYHNRLIFVDLNQAIYSLLKKVPDNLDDARFESKYYNIRFESVKLGDIKNHWTILKLKDSAVPESKSPDLSDLDKFQIAAQFPPSETMAVIIAYPSAHEAACETISRLKKLGYKTSLSLHEYSFEYSFGYSHYSTMIKAD